MEVFRVNGVGLGVKWVGGYLQIFLVLVHVIIILGLCYHFSPFYGGTPPWIASTDVCLGPILSRWFPGCRLKSSLHLVFGLPHGLNHLCGTQDVALMVHLLS